MVCLFLLVSILFQCLDIVSADGSYYEERLPRYISGMDMQKICTAYIQGGVCVVECSEATYMTRKDDCGKVQSLVICNDICTVSGCYCGGQYRRAIILEPEEWHKEIITRYFCFTNEVKRRPFVAPCTVTFDNSSKSVVQSKSPETVCYYFENRNRELRNFLTFSAYNPEEYIEITYRNDLGNTDMEVG